MKLHVETLIYHHCLIETNLSAWKISWETSIFHMISWKNSCKLLSLTLLDIVKDGYMISKDASRVEITMKNIDAGQKSGTSCIIKPKTLWGMILSSKSLTNVVTKKQQKASLTLYASTMKEIIKCKNLK